MSCTPSKSYISRPLLNTTQDDAVMDNTLIKITPEILLGAWQLVEFKITKPNGETRNWGPNPNGLLIYDSTGHMSVSINSGSNPDTCKNNLERNILFYAGTYTLSGNKIVHQVSNASDPNRIGEMMIRKAELTKNSQLRLSAKGQYGYAYLLWQKNQSR